MSSLLTNVGLGKFGNNSHPIHPSTVHLPIAFLITASALDILTWVGMKSPGILNPLMKLTTNSSNPDALDNAALLNYLSLFSYASTIAALFTSLPALNSGLIEGYALIKANGLDLSNEKVKTTIIHAALNDVAIAATFYNFWSRRGVEGYVISGTNASLSALMLGGVLYSAYLGGSLVYKLGVGVQRQGEGKEIKEKVLKKVKEEGKKEL